MKTVHVIGVGLGYGDITEKQHAIIARAGVLVGGRRHLEWFNEHDGEKREITAPVDAIIEDIRRLSKTRRVVVLASGDPLFYGIGETILSRLGTDTIQIHPNVSVMAAAFARIGRTWKDAVAVSLHGRGDSSGFLAALDKNRPVFVFTDRQNTPASVGQTAFSHAGQNIRMCVLERLGETDERITWIDSAEAAKKDWRTPNAVILLPEAPGKQCAGFSPAPGYPDDGFAHDAGMITKPEVRAISLSKLHLREQHVMWDLGAGSGAVAVEAAGAMPRGRVAAVEKNPARISNIRENIKRFNIKNVDVHQLTLPDGMDDLPDPDRVFVGGGGKDLPEILRAAARRLAPGGRMVVNAVVLESVTATLGELEKEGFLTETVCVQVSRGAAMPAGTRFYANNPVYVIAAQKPAHRVDTPGCRHEKTKFPVLFVGAGPGDPELITLKGKNALADADLVIYAGSLIPDAALAWTNPAAQTQNSAAMHLDEMVGQMASAQRAGKRVVRLHSGDPCLYGAIAEQMNALEAENIPFAVIPGVTAAFAAAAALGVEYTVPEKTQTLILTRAAGRTPVPEAEDLARLAGHNAAMAIYLSAGLAQQVESALVAAYGTDAPVAVVHRASRPDEKTIRTTAGALSRTMAESGITSTALIIAGPSLGANRGVDAGSKLYDKHFTHGCRKGTT